MVWARFTHSGNQSLISCSAESVESDPWHTLRPTLFSVSCVVSFRGNGRDISAA